MGKKSLTTHEMANFAGEFESIYEANQPRIYRFMFWHTKDEMLAQDLTSHVFEKAWRTRQSFTGGSGKAWLFKIARTTLIDHWRKIKEVADDGSIIARAESPATPIENILDRETVVKEVQAAVDRLPAAMQNVVRLRFIRGKSARQTGRLLGLSEANVRVIQYRALQKLRKYLHEN